MAMPPMTGYGGKVTTSTGAEIPVQSWSVTHCDPWPETMKTAANVKANTFWYTISLDAEYVCVESQKPKAVKQKKKPRIPLLAPWWKRFDKPSRR